MTLCTVVHCTLNSVTGSDHVKYMANPSHAIESAGHISYVALTLVKDFICNMSLDAITIHEA